MMAKLFFKWSVCVILPAILWGWELTEKYQPDNSRIVNGDIVTSHEFPWIVSLQLIDGPKNYHLCGGSLISAGWVVTAAHCFDYFDPENYWIVAGILTISKPEATKQVRRIAKKYTNGYKYDRLQRDIALLKLDEDFILDGETVSPITVPNSDLKVDAGKVTYAGWGATRARGTGSNELLKIPANIESYAVCKAKFNANPPTYNMLSGCQVCTNYNSSRGPCQGDSGGPVMLQKDGITLLWGIVSGVIGCADHPKFPDLNTDVACFSDWICETTGIE